MNQLVRFDKAFYSLLYHFCSLDLQDFDEYYAWIFLKEDYSILHPPLELYVPFERRILLSDSENGNSENIIKLKEYTSWIKKIREKGHEEDSKRMYKQLKAQPPKSNLEINDAKIKPKLVSTTIIIRSVALEPQINQTTTKPSCKIMIKPKECPFLRRCKKKKRIIIWKI